jgi:protein-S-isoprenylcysteine O-methyltransferase Ste14
LPGLALALLAVYGTLALGVRAILQLQHTGSTGVMGISGRPGSIEWVAGVLFEIALGVCIAAPILDLTEVIAPIPPLDGGFAHVAGVVLAAGGTIATVAAQSAMGDAWRVGVDHEQRTELVTRGPFAVVRNPIFAAMIPTFTGIALLTPSVVAITGVVLLVVSLELQIRLVEEPHLRRMHGPDYTDYTARVGRFIPGIGRIRR